jgi:hypothetical protein
MPHRAWPGPVTPAPQDPPGALDTPSGAAGSAAGCARDRGDPRGPPGAESGPCGAARLAGSELNRGLDSQPPYDSEVFALGAGRTPRSTA